jgi:hypothetical protein
MSLGPNQLTVAGMKEIGEKVLFQEEIWLGHMLFVSGTFMLLLINNKVQWLMLGMVLL